MALVDLKSNLANFRSEFKTPSVESQAVKRLDQPSAIKTQFLPNDSRLDVDSIPTKFTATSASPLSNINVVNTSVLNIDTIPRKYINIGSSNLSNVSIVNSSLLNVDDEPEVYNRRTKFTKTFVDRSIFNRDDNLITVYSNRTKFTIRYINTSKFNIDTNPDKFINTGLSKLSLPRFINRSTFNIDTTPSKFSISGASKLSNKKIVNASQFNIDSVLDKYENVGFRQLSVPRFINRSLLNVDNVPTKHGNDFTKSNYKGISGRSFKFPNILTAVFRTNAVELKNSKFGSRGFATVENQLGAGSLFHYTINGAKNNKIFSSRGYADQLKYGDVVRGGRGWQGVNSLLFQKATEQNSPSAIEEQYKKFNLRDEAYNYSYINHPLILRGIQRKGKEEPNRWGIDGVVNFDSGLVRGGITAATARAANDTARLAKWIASPKGLLWVVKQLGLGLSNPKVEAIGGPLTRLTRIHTGVASLLSVPTTAFGLHFTRHGIPFANEVASYENVINFKNQTFRIPGIGNRLIGLSTEYGVGITSGGLLDVSNDTFTQTIVSRLRTTFNLGPNAFGSTLLSGLGGAQSVYGIGFTSIRRTTNTVEKAKENAKNGKYGNFVPKWNDVKSYTRFESGNNSRARILDEIDNPNSFYSIRTLFNEVSKATLKLQKTTKKPKGSFFENPEFQVEISVPYNPDTTKIDSDAKRLIDTHNPVKPTYYSGADRAKTGKESVKESEVNSLTRPFSESSESSLSAIASKALVNSKKSSITESSKIKLPNSNNLTPNPFERLISKEGSGTHLLNQYDNLDTSNKIKQYATIAYNKIPDRSKDTVPSFNDFRDSIKSNDSYIGKQDSTYYANFNLETRYGFAKSFNRDIQGSKVKARGEGSFIIKGQQYSGGEDAKGKPTKSTPWDLVNRDTYTGDKITGIDIIKSPTDPAKIYSNIKGGNTKDFIKFYFADGEMNNTTQVRRAMVFRATISGLTDTFSPSWGSIQIMGRPDSVYRYDSFERSISFSFKAYAMTRSEMIPMWRKLNYLASFTAPDYVGGYVAGPFMRLTLGDLYQNCPGFIESLSYTFPDEGTWDIADDDDPDAKQLPMMVDVSVGYKIIGTHRPINMGRMYALGPNDSAADVPGQWLGNSNKYEDPGVDEGGFTKGTGDPENTTENTGFTGNQGLGQGDNNIA